MNEMNQKPYFKGNLVISETPFRVPISAYTIVNKNTKGLSKRSLCCNTFINYQEICNKCRKILNDNEIGKGFAVANELIPVDMDQLAKIKPQSTDNIVISGIIDKFPMNLATDKQYYLAVNEEKDKKTKEIRIDQTSREAYSLLQESLKETNKILIGTTVIRNTGYIVAVSSYNDKLLLSLLFFAENLKTSIDLEYIKPPKDKLETAISFLQRLPLADIKSFKDEYAENLRRLLYNEPLIQLKEIKTKEVSNAISMFQQI